MYEKKTIKLKKPTNQERNENENNTDTVPVSERYSSS